MPSEECKKRLRDIDRALGLVCSDPAMFVIRLQDRYQDILDWIIATEKDRDDECRGFMKGIEHSVLKENRKWIFQEERGANQFERYEKLFDTLTFIVRLRCQFEAIVKRLD
jgi:hypothetical protein